MDNNEFKMDNYILLEIIINEVNYWFFKIKSMIKNLTDQLKCNFRFLPKYTLILIWLSRIWKDDYRMSIG